jgi:hypothetical protein
MIENKEKRSRWQFESSWEWDWGKISAEGGTKCRSRFLMHFADGISVDSLKAFYTKFQMNFFFSKMRRMRKCHET